MKYSFSFPPGMFNTSHQTDKVSNDNSNYAEASVPVWHCVSYLYAMSAQYLQMLPINPGSVQGAAI